MSVIKTLAKLGAGADIVSGGELEEGDRGAACRLRRSCFRASARRATRSPRRSMPASISSTSRARKSSTSLTRSRSSKGATRCDGVARQSGRRCAARMRRFRRARPRTSSGSVGRARRRPMPMRRNCRALTWPASLFISAARSPSLGPSARRLRRSVDLVRKLARGRLSDFADRPGRRLGRSLQRKAWRRPFPENYGAVVREAVAGLDAQLIVEPGRLITANAGVLISRGDLRQAGRRKGVPHPGCRDERSDPPCPLRCLARYRAGAAQRRRRNAGFTTWWGRCAKARTCSHGIVNYPPLSAGDLVAILSAGAYGAVQASGYNARPLGPGNLG